MNSPALWHRDLVQVMRATPVSYREGKMIGDVHIKFKDGTNWGTTHYLDQPLALPYWALDLEIDTVIAQQYGNEKFLWDVGSYNGKQVVYFKEVSDLAYRAKKAIDGSNDERNV